MSHKRDFDRAIEARSHFKNGMNQKWKPFEKVFLIVLLLVLCLNLFAQNNQQSLPEYTAKQYYRLWDGNQLQAEQLYKGKRTKITGIVIAIGRTLLTNEPCVSIDIGLGNELLFGLICVFPENAINDLVNLKKAQTVTIIGYPENARFVQECIIDKEAERLRQQKQIEEKLRQQKQQEEERQRQAKEQEEERKRQERARLYQEWLQQGGAKLSQELDGLKTIADEKLRQLIQGKEVSDVLLESVRKHWKEVMNQIEGRAFASFGDSTFIIIEHKPLFQGGDENNFAKWVNERVEYPEIAVENGVQGRVLVSYVVNTDGRVIDVTILRGVDPALDKEAVRVVSSSPRWIPGYQRDKAVKVRYNFPVIFQLR